MSLHTKFTGITGCETRQATGGTGSELQRRDRERGVTAPGARAGLTFYYHCHCSCDTAERPAGGTFHESRAGPIRHRDWTYLSIAVASTKFAKIEKRGSRAWRPELPAVHTRPALRRLAPLRTPLHRHGTSTCRADSATPLSSDAPVGVPLVAGVRHCTYTRVGCGIAYEDALPALTRR